MEVMISPLVSNIEDFDLNSESTWKKLYPFLESLARYFVCSSNILIWRGQINDIIEDIVQETARRLIERTQKVERGEALPIQSLKSMLYTIAHNYCEDLRRHDRRLVREKSQDTSFGTYLNQINPAEVGIENVYQDMLFKLVAREVAAFPHKQRRAVLIDLANRMHFGKRPTPLQQAFLDLGIELHVYKQVLPSNPQMRSRHSALVNYAYNRIARLELVQRYIELT